MQIPFQLDYVQQVVAQAKERQEGTALMTQRIASSQEASTSEPAEPDPQYNTDVSPEPCWPCTLTEACTG